MLGLTWSGVVIRSRPSPIRAHTTRGALEILNAMRRRLAPTQRHRPGIGHVVAFLDYDADAEPDPWPCSPSGTNARWAGVNTGGIGTVLASRVRRWFNLGSLHVEFGPRLRCLIPTNHGRIANLDKPVEHRVGAIPLCDPSGSCLVQLGQNILGARSKGGDGTPAMHWITYLI